MQKPSNHISQAARHPHSLSLSLASQLRVDMPLNNGERSKSDGFIYGCEANTNKTKRKKNVKGASRPSQRPLYTSIDGLVLLFQHQKKTKPNQKSYIQQEPAVPHPLHVLRKRAEPGTLQPSPAFFFCFHHSEVDRKTSACVEKPESHQPDARYFYVLNYIYVYGVFLVSLVVSKHFVYRNGVTGTSPFLLSTRRFVFLFFILFQSFSRCVWL